MSKRRKKPSPSPGTAVIESFSHDGRGIARVNGKTTFIQNALPNETVSFQYLKQKRDFDEGRMLSVLHPSPLRTEPKCVHYSLCGGCSWQQLTPDAQIIEKQTVLLDLLSRIGHVTPESVYTPLSGPHWHYRNKARLSVRYVEKKGKTLVGFREKNNPRFITDITHCVILNQKVDEQLPELCSLIDSFSNPSAIAQIEVAAGDEDVALIFRNLESLDKLDEDKLIEFSQKTHFRIYLQPGGPDSVFLLYPHNDRDYLTYSLPAEDIVFHFHPTDFTQVNASINRDMVQFALNLMEIDKTDTVLDLFCGLGNFSLPMAKYAAHVTGIEGSHEMVQRASMNAMLNQLNNTAFYAANLEDASAFDLIGQAQFTKMLLDPPRAGALTIVKQMQKINPERIVYVSCNPATLARDADILTNHQGYSLEGAGVMDMFPHTAHVESIALFKKR